MNALNRLVGRLYRRLVHRVPQATVNDQLEKYDKYLVKHFADGNPFLWAGGEYIDDDDVSSELDYARKHPIVV